MESKLTIGNIFAFIGFVCAVLGLLLYQGNKIAQFSILAVGVIIALFGFLLSKSKS